ncbi:MAG: hypothetical protein DDT32_02286 [Syntrophomonadaceae bacterium]|nr:hypothetical protein [Bacillota bacterium]
MVFEQTQKFPPPNFLLPRPSELFFLKYDFVSAAREGIGDPEAERSLLRGKNVWQILVMNTNLC